MTKAKKFYTFIFSLLIIITSNAQESEKVNTGALGDVKYSILNPEQFAIVNGGGWILLDGRKLSSESDLYKLLYKTGHSNIIPDDKLPNGDGVFIRGVDTDEADNYGEIKKNRIVGSYQEDLLETHNHPLNLRGNDSDGGNCNSTLNGCGGGSKAKNLSSGDTGGAETRPKNISLYVYIKIYKN